MNEGQEFRHRQLRLMSGAIKEFTHQEVGLMGLVRRLKALHAALGASSPKFDEEFMRAWIALESINAVESDRKERAITSEKAVVSRSREDELLINESLSKLERLINSEVRP